MTIGINATPLSGAGIDVYVRNLVDGLARIDPTGDYAIFSEAPLPAGYLREGMRLPHYVIPARYVTVPVPYWNHKLTWSSVMLPTGTLPLGLRRTGLTTVHMQTVAPVLLVRHLIVTVHDITFERFPQFYPPDLLTKLRIRVPLTTRRATTVLTDSEFSRQDILRRYCIDPDKVVVAHLAADRIFAPMRDLASLADVRVRYNTGDHFILYVGDLQPRKNLVSLIKAYVRLRKADAIRHRLVLIGRTTWLFDEIFASARDCGFADDLIFTGFVPNDDLVALYNAADLFVYVPIIEGFGLPPLEAMACGTPVVTSSTSSLPEVVGDAALTVDPLNVEEIARTIMRGLTDEMERNRLRVEGQRRATQFSWDRTAHIVRNVYHKIADQSR